MLLQSQTDRIDVARFRWDHDRNLLESCASVPLRSIVEESLALCDDDVPSCLFAIINPVFVVTDDSFAQHPLRQSLELVVEQRQQDVAVWHDGADIHALVSAESEALLDERIAEICRQFEAYEVLIDNSITPVPVSSSKRAKEGEIVQNDEVSNRKGDALAAFRTATATQLADLSPVELVQLEERLDDAKLIQARRLIGLSDEEKLTLGKVNSFFKRNAGATMDNNDALLLTRLVKFLRAVRKAKLFLDVDGSPVECTLTSIFRNDRNTRRFDVREIGIGQERLWSRSTLPSGLSLKRG